MSPRLLFAVWLLPAAAAAAPIPASIEAMLRGAEPGELATVAAVARRTAPDSAAEIDTLVAALKAEQAARAEAALAEQGFVEGWRGEGALGGSFSTGNTEERGFSASLTLKKRGIDWEHNAELSFDYLSTDGTARRERIYAGYTGRYDLTGRLFFAFGLVSYERDRFSGIDHRFTESLGVGYRLVDSARLRWSVEAGPALRQTDFTEASDQSRVELLSRTDIDWRINERVRLTESAGAVWSNRGNSSLYSKSALTASILGDLSARLSFDVLHETDPPEGREQTDTITRASLVYDF